jgi:4-amino-4-deoxy-L-arabinose transferase-like glycosyltransferase
MDTARSDVKTRFPDSPAIIARVPERTLLAMVVLLAAVLRLVHLGHQGLWVDEMMTVTVATPKPGYPLWQLLRHNIHGPLHTFVVAMFRLVSENDAWLRLPSALAGIASVPLLFAWMKPRFGARAALWGALLLAVNPLHIHYSQELRNYAFAVCFVLLGCVQLDRLLAGWSRARAAALGACVAAAVLSNFSATFVFAAQSVAWFWSGGVSRRSITRWAGVVAVVLVLVSPWIYRVTTFVDFNRLATPVLPGDLEAAERLRGDTTVRAEAIPYALYCYSVGFTLGPSLRELHEDASVAAIIRRHAAPVAWSALLFGALACAGLAAAGRGAAHGRSRARIEPLLYVFLPLLATLALNWQNAKAFNVRYVLVGLPMYLALVAAGIAGLGRPRWLSPAAGLAVLATLGISLQNYYGDPRYAKEDVRAATRAVESRLAPGECIFAPTVWQIVGHYRRTDAPVHYVYRDPPHLMERQLAEMDAACAGVWYVRARPWVDDADGAVLAALESRYRRGETLEFPGVSVIHFTR